MGNNFPVVDQIHLSDAGAFGEQTKTPLVDISYLAYGLQDDDPYAARVKLPTGSVSPVVIVRALLNHFATLPSPYLTRFGAPHTLPRATSQVHYVDIGTGHSLPMAKTVKPMVGGMYVNQSIYSKIEGPSDFPPLSHFSSQDIHARAKLTAALLLPRLMEPTPFLASQWSWEPVNVIAECVPGGTLTAAMVASVVMGTNVVTASSSTWGEVHARREVLLNIALTRFYEEEGQDVDIRNWGTRSLLKVCDEFQIHLLFVLQAFANALAEIKDSKDRKTIRPLILAGGAQMLAILALFQVRNPGLSRILKDHVEVVTTHWCWHGSSFQTGLKDSPLTEYLKGSFKIRHSDTTFRQSPVPPLNLYSKGLTVEGCGLGAVLYIAETSFNMTSRDISNVVAHSMEREGLTAPSPTIELGFRK